MSPIVYGFLGIALGALLPSLWAWLAIVRTEQTEGMVAARLLDSNLELVERAQGRGDLDAALWLQHRPALARVLDRDAWEVVSRIYRDGGHQGSVAHARIHFEEAGPGKAVHHPGALEAVVRAALFSVRRLEDLVGLT